ncbi:unnamed protein product [Penicillium glandicola]
MALPPAEKKEPMEAQIKSVDMTEDMQQEAIALAIEATEKFRLEKDIAQYIKKEVRQPYPTPIAFPALLTPYISSTHARALPGTAWLVVTLEALLPMVCGQQNPHVNNQTLIMCSTETKHFIYFYLGHCAILLFKTQ